MYLIKIELQTLFVLQELSFVHDNFSWWLFVFAIKTVITAKKTPNTAPARTSDPLSKICQKSIQKLSINTYSDVYNQIFDSKMWTKLTLEIWIVRNILRALILSNIVEIEDKAEKNTFIRCKCY